MLSSIGGVFGHIANFLKWWVSVMPWEQGVRIKFGKHVTHLGPGIHLRVPLMHTVYKQSVRLRRADMPIQTLTTSDGKTVTLAATIGFCVKDVLKLYETLHDASGTLTNIAQSAIAEYVITHPALECSPTKIQAAVNNTLNFEAYGLQAGEVQITDFAFVRTYRLISDSRWGYSHDNLNTSTPLTNGAP